MINSWLLGCAMFEFIRLKCHVLIKYPLAVMVVLEPHLVIATNSLLSSHYCSFLPGWVPCSRNQPFRIILGYELMFWQLRASFVMAFRLLWLPLVAWSEFALLLIVRDDRLISLLLITVSNWCFECALWLRHSIFSGANPSTIVPPCWRDGFVQLKEPYAFIFNFLTLIINAWGEWEIPSPPCLGPLGEGNGEITAGLSLWCE